MKDILDLIQEKEHEFMEDYINLTLQDFCIKYGIPFDYSNFHLGILTDIKQRLTTDFVFYLFQDEEFLSRPILEHYKQGQTQIFALSLLDVYSPCECCGGTLSKWFAISVDMEEKYFSMGIKEVHECNKVEVSVYCDGTISKVKDLLEDNGFDKRG